MDSILAKSYFRFRWAACQLDAIGKCRNRATLHKYLQSIPQGLDETYDRILSSISDEDAPYAVRILRWLAFSTRPLLLCEVAEVAAIDVDREPAFDGDEILENPIEVLDICSSLVKVEMVEWQEFGGTVPNLKPLNKAVKLSHNSVKDYLLSSTGRNETLQQYKAGYCNGHDYLSMACLKYILQIDFACLKNMLQIDTKSESDNPVGKPGLYFYASNEWFVHAQKVDEKSRGWIPLAKSMVSSCRWGSFLWMRGHQFEVEFDPKWKPRQLEIAAYCTLMQLVIALLDGDYDIARHSKDIHEAVRRAARQGNTQMVAMLLGKCDEIHVDYDESLEEDLYDSRFDYGQ